HRLGIHAIKWELEDLAFATLYPRKYQEIKGLVAQQREERETYVERAGQYLARELEALGINARISGRAKHFYSIYSKMTKKGREFNEIYDLTAMRVIVDSVKDCYGAVGVIHSLWKPLPGRFKDFVAMPKFNMYQSLHTTVIGPMGERMEVQIRTVEMHRVAESGIAAHWKYKEGKGYDEKEVKRFAWLRQLLEWQKELQDSREFMDSVKVELFPEEVYVFTPKGDVKSFPKGSTPIDFAYSVHTDVGHRCVGAKVNGKLVPLKYELKTGDIIEVITSPHHTPSKDWLKLVKSSRARNKIRGWIKTEERIRSISLGREIIDKDFRRYSLNYAKLLKSGEIRRVAVEFGFVSEDDLMASVGYGKLSSSQIIGKLIPEEKLEVHKERKETRIGKVIDKLTRKSSSAIQISGVEDVMVRFGKCCNPVPGDDIVGFITRGRGVTVHTADCALAIESDPDRRIEVAWNKAKKTALPVNIRVYCHDQKGILANITLAITNCEANISKATVQSTVDKRGINSFEVEVTDLDHLTRVMTSIKKVEGVIKVDRLKG
ncbi:MAG TPA: bifunctional (p)ppGpp synthetase/guanosine-3',5'-bis(diphosphate) 3'-pyrophosphohydrolase, partial [Geobacteraceae bacterium]|nr:bifunctional (p)ppGpp synthetase/guanosine-3',5'-bis(diphosphate) 3'-pyrophosphohydrolase [Geobacteraceae bacterium]